MTVFPLLRSIGGEAVLVVLGSVVAHVEYVLLGDADETIDALRFLLDVLSNPLNVALLLLGGSVAALALVGYRRSESTVRDVAALRAVLSQYADTVPLILRLSIGVPLIGAGFAGYVFSPAVTASGDLVSVVPPRLFSVAVGFCLVFGLATRVVAVGTVLVYLATAAATPTVLLASEYVGALVAISLLGSGRLSIDHLLYRVATTPQTLYGRVDPVHAVAERVHRHVEPYERYAPTALRLALGFNFVYLGVVEKLLLPGRALAVVEGYGLTAVVPVDPGLWVVGAALTEIALGCALLAGFYTRAVAAAAFSTFTLTLFALPNDPVLAHASLFGLATAVFVAGAGPLALDADPTADHPTRHAAERSWSEGRDAIDEQHS